MDDISLTSLPVKPRALPQWAVDLGGVRVGRVVQKRIGKSSSVFYEGIVYIAGREISVEVSTDRDERVRVIVDAWRQPESNVHVAYWLGLRHSPASGP